jgi:D-apiose dehydrogenase
MSFSELKGVMAGAGFFAQFHADAWRRTEGARITAIADPEEAKARAFAEKWGIPRVYSDAAAMLAAEKPDFLDIVTGPATHRALAELGASEKVTVISQKPMAPSLEDSVAMVETCTRAGVRLLVHENWRWQPWYREARRLIGAGALGRVFHIGFRMRTGDGRGANPYTVQPYFRGMRRFLIFETLVHFLDTLRFLGGEIGTLYCRTARINPIIAGEDCGILQLTFVSGAQGLIDANRISGPLPPPTAFATMQLEGDEAQIRMDDQGRLFTTRYGEAEREHQFPIPAIGYKGDSILALHRHFVECLRDGRPSESEGVAYLATVRAVFAAYESTETGLPVSLR